MLHWRVNGLSMAMLLLTSVLLLASALYAPRYFNEVVAASWRRKIGFWLLLGLLTASLSLIWLAADLLLIYIGLEVMGLTAVGLMLLPGQAEARRAGLRYLLLSLLGSLTFLLGVALLWGFWGRLDLAGLAQSVEPGLPLSMAMALISAGLLLKAAVFPLHAWLTPVHAAAWIPVSALHAGLVIKASFFCPATAMAAPAAGCGQRGRADGGTGECSGGLGSCNGVAGRTAERGSGLVHCFAAGLSVAGFSVTD